MSNRDARNRPNTSAVPFVKAAEATTTPESDTAPKTMKIDKKEVRRKQNEELLKSANVKAFLDTIAEAEGGDYSFKFGAVKGMKNDPWRISDYSLPPGPGADNKTTASGRYQINRANWEENGKKKMGLNDFTPHSQDLIAVEGLRYVKAIDAIVEGDMAVAIGRAAKLWNAFPQGPGATNRVKGQHFIPYDEVVAMFKRYGGTVKE